MRVLFTTAVWGEDYVERFIRYSLPTQLASGNIDVAGPGSAYFLYTYEEYIPLLEQHPAIVALGKLVRTEILPIEPLLFDARGLTKYSVLTATQNDALSRSRDFDVIFFGYADMIWSAGSYDTALKRIAQGYTAVFSHGYPVQDLEFRQFLDEQRPDRPLHSLSVSTETMSRGILDRLHPLAKSNYWTNERLGCAPSYLFWGVEGQGVVTRAFHLHPIAVKVEHGYPNFFAPFISTLDEEFCARLAQVPSRLYVSRSSLEICLCSLFVMDGTDYYWQPPRKPNVVDLAVFAEGHAGMIHRLLARVPIRLIREYTDESAWQAVEKEAEDVLRQVFDLLATSDETLAIECPHAFHRRMSRRRLLSLSQHVSSSNENFYQRVSPSGSLYEFCEVNSLSSFGVSLRLIAARLRLKIFLLVYGRRLSEPLALCMTRHQCRWRGKRLLATYCPISKMKRDPELVQVITLERVPTASLLHEIIMHATGLYFMRTAGIMLLRRATQVSQEGSYRVPRGAANKRLPPQRPQ